MKTKNTQTGAGNTTAALILISAEKHTPGPWLVQHVPNRMGMGKNRETLEIVHNYSVRGGQQVVVGKHTGIDCLTPGNARLIASAPELLSALKGMMEWARRVNVSNPGPEIVAAHNAISKAEGVQP